MKILKILLGIVGVLIVAYFVLYFLGPDKVYMERSITIEKSPQKVYNSLVSFKTFNEWSPWAAKDTTTVYTFTGPKSGVGTSMSWTSESDQVGSGSMTIEEAVPNSMILVRMQFGFPGETFARYKIEPAPEGTKLTWTYEDEPGSYSKAMSALMDIETFLGPDYENGLKNFKNYIESIPEPQSMIPISLETSGSITYLGVTSTLSSPTSEKIGKAMGQAYGKLTNYMKAQSIEPNGMPLTVYIQWGEEETTMISGIPVADNTTSSNDNFPVLQITESQVVKAIHKGDYKKLSDTYAAIQVFIESNGLEISGNPYEIYVTDPGEETDTTQWITEVYYPVKQ